MQIQNPRSLAAALAALLPACSLDDIDLSGGGGAGAAPRQPAEGVADAKAEPPPPPAPDITTERAFSGDPLYEWISGAGPLTFYRYEPAAFVVKAHGEAGVRRTLFLRLDGETVATRALEREAGDEPVRLAVDTDTLDEGLHRFEAEVVTFEGVVRRSAVDFEVVFNVTAVAADPLFGGVVAGTVEAGAYWFPPGGGAPRRLPGELLDQGSEGNLRFGTYPVAAPSAQTSGLSILRAVYDPDLGGFWLGTLFQGLTLFLPGADAGGAGPGDRFVRVHPPNDDLAPLPAGKEAEWTEPWWQALTGLSSRDSVAGILADAGGVWLGTFRGLLRWDHGGTPADASDDVWTRVGAGPGQLTDPHIAALAKDGAGRLWIGTFDLSPEGEPALFVHDPALDAWRGIGPADGLDADRVLSVAVGNDGAVWAGTDDGLYRVEPPAPGAADLAPAAVRRYGAADGLRDEDVLAVLPERQGPGVWFGTADVCGGDGGGLHRLRPRPDGATDVVVVTREDGLADDDVTSLAHSPGGGLWVGTFNLLAAATLNAVAGVDIPECDAGARPIQARTGRDGLSHVVAHPGAEGRSFEVVNY